MAFKINEIRQVILKIPFVKNILNLELRENFIIGKVEIFFKELENPIDFNFEINAQYPLKSYDSESLKFYNINLIDFNHVMADGSICVHTSHCTDLEQKLIIDFNSLKNWIIKYYINKDSDLNYEHIIATEDTINDTFYSYIFSDVNYDFRKGDFGEVQISNLKWGIYKGKPLLNFLVQGFVVNQSQLIKCDWSNFYFNFERIQSGFYIFIEDAPVKFNRFAFKNWAEFIGKLSSEFLSLLYNFEIQNKIKLSGRIIPLFIGYRTIKTENHWQVALLEIGKFPLQGVPGKINNIKTGIWDSQLINEKITWSLSRNSSYKYFFGRGALSKIIIEKRILIIGIGAIGSMVANTLTRGGCKNIDFVDYDVKEPENVCRSEYMFFTGITNKADELKNILSAISPFVNIQSLNNNYFESYFKSYHKDSECRAKFAEELNKYDLIFDCTTDNDLMYVLDALDLTTELINMSITNHANELVCAFYPNIYQFVINQFSNILKNDVDDLHNPTGCWSPTFKASYNDINVLVQLALKHINILFAGERLKNNFVIETDKMNFSNLKIVEY